MRRRAARQRDRASTTETRKRDTGLTLLELVAATAIFALVSLMALQALTGGLIQRQVIETADAEQAALQRTLALLRQDLSAAVPLPWLPGSADQARPLARPSGGGFALSRAGLPAGFDPGDPGLARVVWRVDPTGQQLRRQVLPLMASASPEPPEHTILDGVSAIRLTPRGAWPEAPEGLPPGFELELETRRWGLLRLVVAR